MALTLEFPPSSRYESLETYYSFPNIDASNNHLKVLLDDGKTLMDIHISIGCYEIKAINNELQSIIMKKIGYKEDEKRIILSPNPNTLRCVLEILHESVDSISMLMIVCAKFSDLTRSTKQEDTKVKILSTY